MSNGRNDIVAKYDELAAVYSGRYANPLAVARRQADLIMYWGEPVGPGSHVLEIGCADGFVTEELVRRGLIVTALDISPRMIATAKAHMQASSLAASFVVHDIESFEPDRRYAAILGVMHTFFFYIREPAVVLGRLERAVERKIVVDLDPRRVDPEAGMRLLSAVGFKRTDWLPQFLPTRYRVPQSAIPIIEGLERAPVVRRALLRWKGHVVIKGERTGTRASS